MCPGIAWGEEMWGVSQVCYFCPSALPLPRRSKIFKNLKIVPALHLSKKSKVWPFGNCVTPPVESLHLSAIFKILLLFIFEMRRTKQFAICLMSYSLRDILLKCTKVHISEIKSSSFIGARVRLWVKPSPRERVECLFPSEFSKMGNLGGRHCWCALCKTMKVKGPAMNNNLPFKEAKACRSESPGLSRLVVLR